MNFGVALAFTRIGQIRAVFAQPALRLLQSVLLRRQLQSKQEITGLDDGTSTDGERFQGARLRGSHIDEFAFDVALHAIGVRMIAACQDCQRGNRNCYKASFHCSDKLFSRSRAAGWMAPSSTILVIRPQPALGVSPSSSIRAGFTIAWTAAS